MLKYIAKISMDIFPSVLATIIGAYIVNHYINAKPAADAPAAVTAPAEAGKNGKPADVANLPAPGVKAKGISEKKVTDKPAAEKTADQPAPESKTSTADVAPPEAAARGKPSAREKAVAKSTPAVSAPAPATPVVEANSAPAAATPAATPDANDLVRAAIERLRKSPESKAAEAKASDTKPSDNKSSETKSSETKSPEKIQEPAVREAARTPEAPRVIPVDTSSVRPLPPPITVSTPAAEAYGNGGSSQAGPPYTASVGNENPNRLTPPADIPVPMIAPPLDLRADAGASMPRPKTNVADDMLSGVKSMFHSVLPKSVTPD
ncbi:hypothetical protein IVB45_30250 [Bradyrhizobium sp. 4]|uniref:hypothetical protein n=1 Tax=unclassified Bradyrhizobium TaxID=2631580 RepID=UPI001FFBD5FF|nr:MULTISPECIES: hypothetical protein [unclassified Bradyrhizobium]MCK1399237.1 hypothetical protein [Bradyrhizobium sp. 39]MCK1746963.1 hypothetical protein [Bradyrhizobium sp. 135]UPJ34162.1 hypothetical protein IVB45_30250 [Bradyrhizobium sp. 4]